MFRVPCVSVCQGRLHPSLHRGLTTIISANLRVPPRQDAIVSLSDASTHADEQRRGHRVAPATGMHAKLTRAPPAKLLISTTAGQATPTDCARLVTATQARHAHHGSWPQGTFDAMPHPKPAAHPIPSDGLVVRPRSEWPRPNRHSNVAGRRRLPRRLRRIRARAAKRHPMHNCLCFARATSIHTMPARLSRT